MTTPYIYRRPAMRALLVGLMVHIGTSWRMFNSHAHAHRCLGCFHVVVCLCVARSRLELTGCPWCSDRLVDWRLTWRNRPRKAPRKRKAKARPEPLPVP